MWIKGNEMAVVVLHIAKVCYFLGGEEKESTLNWIGKLSVGTFITTEKRRLRYHF